MGKQSHSYKITTTQVSTYSLERLKSSVGKGKHGRPVRFSDVLLDLQGFHLFVNLLNVSDKKAA